MVRQAIAAMLVALVTAAPASAQIVPMRWTGVATVADARGPIRLGVRTAVMPAGGARSESWRLGDPAPAVRTLVITPAGGWIERDGRRLPLPVATVAHERQQFALYRQMQQALRQGPALASRGVRRLTVPAPPGGVATGFGLDATGALVDGTNIVTDPGDADRRIVQTFRFDRASPVGGLMWPRRIAILRDGRPWFTLVIDTITVDGPG